jgi:hypothetical protein
LDFRRPARGSLRAAQKPGFSTLDSLGIPWILSSEISLFNRLRATSGRFFLLGSSFSAEVGRPLDRGYSNDPSSGMSHELIVAKFLELRKQMPHGCR